MHMSVCCFDGLESVRNYQEIGNELVMTVWHGRRHRKARGAVVSPRGALPPITVADLEKLEGGF